MNRRRLGLLMITPIVVVMLAVGAAWAYWSAASTSGGNGASAATAVNQGATPTASAIGLSVTVDWDATTLTSGQAVSGYQVRRYDADTLALQTILSDCAGTIAGTTCTENTVPLGSWKYTVTPRFATNWQGPESAKSDTVVVDGSDATPPANVITLSGITGGAVKIADTIYYRGVAAGSFTLTNAVTDADSGPASSETAALTGTTTGWTYTPSTVSTPAGGPYVSNAFSWTAGTTSTPGEVVTGRDVANNTANTTLSFVNDSTAPTAGTVTYTDGYEAGASVAVTFTTGTDTSGIATASFSAPPRRSRTATAAPSAGSPTGAGEPDVRLHRNRGGERHLLPVRVRRH